jgi:hypothetical protein
VRRTERRRVVRVTAGGQQRLPGVLGLAPDWAQPPAREADGAA